MRHKRELIWWAGACAAAVALSTLLGGFIGPIVTLFALVLLAGAVLIEFEGPQAVTADGYLDDAVGDTTFAEPEPAPELEPSSAGSEQSPAVEAEVEDTDEAVAKVDDTEQATDTGNDDHASDAGAEAADDAVAAAAAVNGRRATASA